MNRLLGTLTGLVSDAAGGPVADAAVVLGDGPPHPDIAAVTGASGQFRFDALEPGEYEVIVNRASAGTARVSSRVEAGRITRIHVTLI
jgi:protocatechuate 3,4-dioxygenase beta subunit